MSNYIDFRTSVQPYLKPGRYPVRQEIRRRYYPVAVDGLHSSSPPTDSYLAIGASGSIEVNMHRFVYNQNDYERIWIPAPSGIVDDEDVTPFLVWRPQSSWTSGTFIVHLDYLVKDLIAGFDVTAGTPTNINMTLTPADANTCIVSDFADLVDVNTGEAIFGIIKRLLADPGTSTVGLDLIGYGIEYTKWIAGDEYGAETRVG